MTAKIWESPYLYSGKMYKQMILQRSCAQKECTICFEPLFAKNSEAIVQLERCRHVWHESCLRETVLAELNNLGKVEFECPEANCKCKISQKELKKLLSKEQFDKLQLFKLKRKVEADENLSFCPTNDCMTVFDRKTMKEFHCKTCAKHFCLDCQTEVHPGLTCA